MSPRFADPDKVDEDPDPYWTFKENWIRIRLSRESGSRSDPHENLDPTAKNDRIRPSKNNPDPDQYNLNISIFVLRVTK